MKLTTEQSAFAQGTALVARGLMNRPPHPVLAGVKLTAVPDGLTITGFDYERSTVLHTPANVTTPGEAVVSGRLLADIAKSLPAKPVELSLDADRVTIVCGTARYTLNTLPLTEYPGLPVAPPESGTISGPLLAAAVAQVAPAAARDNTLPALTSVRIEATSDTQLTLSATDRYRIAVRRVQWKCPAAPDTPDVCVPADHLLGLTKAAGGTETIRLHFPTANSLVGITAEPMAVTMRQLEEKPPNYRPLWPKPGALVSRIRVDRTALIEATHRVSLVLGKAAPIRLDCAASRITLAGGTSDDAQAHDRVDAILDGEPMRIAFNPGYLGDALDAIDTPEVEICLQSPTKPGLFLPANGEDDPDLQYLVMPVRLS